jgi:uroporphyrinogen-III synthase
MATPRTDPPGVLVTRPADQASGLCEALRNAGYRTNHQPLLELEAVEELSGKQRRCLMDLDSYQHVVFVSANAVRYGMDYIAGFWPQLPVGLAWYAVGSQTAALLEQSGLRGVNRPQQDMSSEGLLALPQLQQVANESVLIIRGEGGRTTLQEELERRGAQVDTLECYRRSCPALAPGEMAKLLEREQTEVVLISSGEGFTNMVALLSPQERTKFRDVCLIVPSSRVAEMAAESGFSRVITAANASDEAMRDALGQWTGSTGE